MAAHRYWRLHITEDGGNFGGGNHFCNITEIKFFDQNLSQISTAGGTKTDSGHFSTDDASKAFDGNTSTVCSLNTNSFYPGNLGSAWIKIDFGAGNEIDPSLIGLQSTSSQGPSECQFQYSDDDSNWTDWGAAGTGGATVGTSTRPWYFSEAEYADASTVAHRYWRVLIISTNNISAWVASCTELEFRSSVGGSDLISGGTVLFGTQSGGNPATNAVDNNNSTFWIASGNLPDYIGYDFGSGVTHNVVEMAFRVRNDAFYINEQPVNMLIQYSDDGSSWTTRWTEYDEPITWTQGQQRIFTNPNALGGGGGGAKGMLLIGAL